MALTGSVHGGGRRRSAPRQAAPAWIALPASSLVGRAMALTLEPAGHKATHWTVRAMAKAVGITASSVVKIWHENEWAPPRCRSFSCPTARRLP